MKKARSPGPPVRAEERKIPAARARRRGRLIVTLSLAALAVVTVVPALLVRPLSNPGGFAIFTGVAAGFGLWLLRGSCWAIGSYRLHSQSSRFLTARTWTGRRTIDLRAVKSIRTRKIFGRWTASYLIVRDTSGVCLAFRDQPDILLVGRMLEEQQRQQRQAAPVRISRLARAVLGISPLSRGLPALWALASVALMAVTAFAPVPVVWLIVTR
jgi:hypothetical protein